MPHFTNDSPFNVHGTAAIQDRPAIEGRGTEEQDTVSSKELMALTGSTYRQIDYWCSRGYIHPVEDDTPGSGNRRRFDSSYVDKVKLMVKISKAFSRENTPLGQIVEHYEDGEFNLGDGVYLTWDVIEIERDVK